MNITPPFSASAEAATFSEPLPKPTELATVSQPEETAPASTDHHVMTLLHRAGQTGAVKTLRGSLGRYANRLPSRGL